MVLALAMTLSVSASARTPMVLGARLTPTGAALAPAAPTNGMIAFFARNRPANAGNPLDLMVMNADGSSPRAIVRDAVTTGYCGFGLDWSPDGNRIAYASTNGVWVVDANGSNNHRITQYCGGSLSWSPKGDWLAIQAANTDGTFLLHPDGTGARYLRPDHGNYYEFDPAFAADGNTVVELTVVLGDGNGWGVYGFAVGDGHLVTRYVSTNDRGSGYIAHGVDVRVDGTRTLIELEDLHTTSVCDPLHTGNAWDDANLYTLGAPPDATPVRIGHTTKQFQMRETDGAWSADGHSVVFVGYRATKCNGLSEVQGPPGIYTMASNGAGVKLLYVKPGAAALVYDPHWQACGPSTKACRVANAKCDGLAATIVGTSAADTLIGTPGNDVIAGLGGRDTIKGLGGADTICGGAGNDTIDGGAGNDTIYGDADNDTVLGGGDTDTVHGGPGSDTVGGGPGAGDQCFGDAGSDSLAPAPGCESVNSIP